MWIWDVTLTSRSSMILSKVYSFESEIDGVKISTNLSMVNDSTQPFLLIIERTILNDNEKVYGKLGDAQNM